MPDNYESAGEGKIARTTIIWSLPSVSVGPDVDYESSNNIASDANGQRIYVKMYINPQSVGISDSKIINETLTKGGYVIQYWGEKNRTFDISGITGSSGIEGINILRRVYRNEQYEYENILKNRIQAAKKEIENSVLENASKLNNITSGPQISLVPTLLTDGIQTAMDIFSGESGSKNVDNVTELNSISTTESLGSLASLVEMHYDGVVYQGYFTQFSYSETANEPGHFSYRMSFVSLREEGVRRNFMPWHRNPLNDDNEPRQSSIPMDSYTSWNLTFPYDRSDNFRFPADKGSINLGNNSEFVGVDVQTDIPGFKPVTRK